MPYNYNNVIHNPSGGFDEIRMKHLIKESCKEVMEEFAIRNSRGLSILQDKVDKLAVQVELLGTIVSSLGGFSSPGSSVNPFDSATGSGIFSSGSYVPNNSFSVEDNRYILSFFPALQRKDASGKPIRVTKIEKVNQFIREQKGLVARDEDSEEEKTKKTNAVKYLKNQLNNFSLIVANEMVLEVEQSNRYQRLNWGEISNVVKKKFYTRLEDISAPLCLPLQNCDGQWVAAALLSKSYENNHNIKKVINISKTHQLALLTWIEHIV